MTAKLCSPPERVLGAARPAAKLQQISGTIVCSQGHVGNKKALFAIQAGEETSNTAAVLVCSCCNMHLDPAAISYDARLRGHLTG